MKKAKLFLENFLIYGLGGIICKIVPFIMLPVVTRLMPNSEYFGLSDMSNTIMNFCIYLAVLGMYDAMYRMFFDKDDENYKRNVCSTAFVFNLFTSLVVFILMIALKKWIATVFFNNQKYAFLVYLTALATLVGGTNSIVSAPTRMQNKRVVYLIANTVGPIISYSVAIPLLLKGYYIIALPLAGLISSALLELSFGIMNRSWFSVKRFDIKLLWQMLPIALPLVPNFLIYWIFNSCDRVMITQIIGIGDSGTYSVGAKLGLASQLIYTAFAGGWQFFAFSTMNEENQVESNSKIYEYLGCLSYISTMCVCLVAKPIYYILFTTEYHRAFIVSPYLFLAPLLQMLFQVACNQLLVVKKTWPNIFILSFGAIINIILNRVLIPIIGIEGAAIATLVGYIISNIVCVLVLKRMKLMIITREFIAATIITVCAFLIWRFCFLENFFGMMFVAIGDFVAILIIYRRAVHKLIQRIKG